MWEKRNAAIVRCSWTRNAKRIQPAIVQSFVPHIYSQSTVTLSKSLWVFLHLHSPWTNSSLARYDARSQQHNNCFIALPLQVRTIKSNEYGNKEDCVCVCALLFSIFSNGTVIAAVEYMHGIFMWKCQILEHT